MDRSLPFSPAQQIKDKALELGFSAVRIGEPVDFAPRLQEWLTLGYHGEMAWMSRDPQVRGNPKTLWPDMKSVIALGLNYGPAEDPRGGIRNRPSSSVIPCAGGESIDPPDKPGDDDFSDSCAYISVYARGDDYHDLVKKRLKALGSWMAQRFKCQLKVFVDTAPVMEKPLAAQAGLGWQGRHTCLVSREFGSWLFLGIIYTDLELPFDAPLGDHCGSCRACLDACPTQAFPRPHQLDARRCLSYLTIEHKGAFPHEFRRAMGNRIYGCDDCLAACPWNKFAKESREMAFAPRAALVGPKLADLARLDDAAFRALFAKSPIKRIGRNQFVRNVLIAIGNSSDTTLTPIARDLMADPDPIVAESARWALEQIDFPA